MTLDYCASCKRCTAIGRDGLCEDCSAEFGDGSCPDCGGDHRGDCPDLDPAPCPECGTELVREHLDCGVFEFGCPNPDCSNRSWWCVPQVGQTSG